MPSPEVFPPFLAVGATRGGSRYASRTVRVADLKRNFSTEPSQAGNDPVAVLNRNRPKADLLPAALYERLGERLEDARLARERADGHFADAALDELSAVPSSPPITSTGLTVAPLSMSAKAWLMAARG